MKKKQEIYLKRELKSLRQQLADRRYALKHAKRLKEKEKRRWQNNKEALRKKNKKYHKKHRRAIWLRHMKNRHRFDSIEKYFLMFKQQKNRCAVCGERFKKTPHVDHDHTCCPPSRSCNDCRRGLLCNDCNLGLGRFKDSIETLKNAIRYLKRYK